MELYSNITSYKKDPSFALHTTWAGRPIKKVSGAPSWSPKTSRYGIGRYSSRSQVLEDLRISASQQVRNSIRILVITRNWDWIISPVIVATILTTDTALLSVVRCELEIVVCKTHKVSVSIVAIART